MAQESLCRSVGQSKPGFWLRSDYSYYYIILLHMKLRFASSYVFLSFYLILILKDCTGGILDEDNKNRAPLVDWLDSAIAFFWTNGMD